jgi:hypothetical protein
MVDMLKGAYGSLHDALIAGLRRLPVPTRLFGPPKGIVESMEQWVDLYRARHPEDADKCWHKTVREQSVARPRFRPSSLGSSPTLPPLREKQPRAFTASIPRARLLVGTGVVISPDDYVFQESCSWGLWFTPNDLEYNTLRPLLRPAEKLSGSYMVLASRMWPNYYHWVSECLTRLCVAGELPEVPIIVPRGFPPGHIESLQLLGVRSERLLFLDDGCYEVEQLLFPSFPGVTQERIADWAFRDLRRRFCGDRPRSTGGKRIYIGRGEATHRRITNEDEVLRALEGEGFVMFEGHRATIAEARDLFADAEVIVGVHGAGMTNILFAPAETPVVEVLDPRHIVDCYCALSTSLDQKYWYFFAENNAAAHGRTVLKGYDDLTIPIDDLLRTLDAAISTKVEAGGAHQ